MFYKLLLLSCSQKQKHFWHFTPTSKRMKRLTGNHCLPMFVDIAESFTCCDVTQTSLNHPPSPLWTRGFYSDHSDSHIRSSNTLLWRSSWLPPLARDHFIIINYDYMFLRGEVERSNWWSSKLVSSSTRGQCSLDLWVLLHSLHPSYSDTSEPCLFVLSALGGKKTKKQTSHDGVKNKKTKTSCLMAADVPAA